MTADAMSAALSLAMAALEDANHRYIRACRAHVHDLLALGADPDVIEGVLLQPLDAIEAEQDDLVERIWELAA